MRQRLELSSSRYLTAIFLVAHCLALFALVTVLPAWAGAASALPLMASFVFYVLRDAWLRLGSSCIGLAADEEGVLMNLRDGTQLSCRITRDSLVTPLLTVLNLRPDGMRGRRSVVILPDSLEAEAFRELRVWLKWGGYFEDGDQRGRGGRQGVDLHQ